MTLSQQLFKSCRRQRHQNANILRRVSYETLTLLPRLFISTFSPALFISRNVFENCFSPSLMICSTQRGAFLFKSIVLTFLTKISTANSIWGFRNVDKVLFFCFLFTPPPFFSMCSAFYISPLTLNWRARSRCVHFISFALPRARSFLSQF